MGKILIIEDNKAQIRLVKQAFKKYDPSITVIDTDNPSEAIDIIQQDEIDLIFVDYVISDFDGITFIKQIKNFGIEKPVVLVTGRGDEKTAVEALKSGAYDYVVKDVGYFNILPHIYKQVMEKYRAEQEINRIQKRILQFNERLMLINSIIKDINQHLDSSYIIDQMLTGSLRLTGSDAAVMALVEGNQIMEMLQKNIELPEGTIFDFIRYCPNKVHVKHLSEHPEMAERLNNYPVKGILCCPVELIANYKALMLLFTFYEDGLNEIDTHAFEIFFDSATSTLKNSLLFKVVSQSQKLWQTTFDSISDSIVVIDTSRTILKCNKSFAALCKKAPKDLVGKPLDQIEEIPDGFKQCIIPYIYQTDPALTDELHCQGKVLLISASPIKLPESVDAKIFTIKDITEFRRLKEQLYHTDKLASLGLLVSGVAHELNNPMTGILGYTELLKMKVTDEDIQKELDKIYNAAERCKRIVENLLTFSRQKPPERTYVQLNDLIESAIDLRAYWLRSNNVKIIKEFGVLPMINIDPQQIQQVIMNLLVNAEHAVTESKKSEKLIKFRTQLDKERDKIVIEVADNGIGIPEDILPRIFDPFFTTKPVDQGTGLGLSISHGIIKEHNGDIWAESIPGEGTSVFIELPVKLKPPENI